MNGSTNSTVPQVSLYFLNNYAADTQEAKWKEAFPQKTYKALFFGQIACAGLAVVIQIILLAMSGDATRTHSTGIWTGILFGLAGSLSLWSMVKPGKCSVSGSVTTSILAIIAAVVLLGLSLNDISLVAKHCIRRTEPQFYYCGKNYTASTVFMIVHCFVAASEGFLASLSLFWLCRLGCWEWRKESSSTRTLQQIHSDDKSKTSSTGARPRDTFVEPVNMDYSIPETIDEEIAISHDFGDESEPLVS